MPLPACWTHESHRDMNGCALTRSVRAQKTENFSGLHAEIEAVEGAQTLSTENTTIFLGHTLELKRSGHLGHSKSPGAQERKVCLIHRMHSVGHLTSSRPTVMMVIQRSPRLEDVWLSFFEGSGSRTKARPLRSMP